MMKRTLIVLLAVCFLIPGILQAKGTILEFKLGYFSPSNADFRDIYGGGINFGAEVTFPVKKCLAIWMSLGYFGKTGELTYTLEETTLRIIPISAGVKCMLKAGAKIDVYGGLGLDYNIYREKNVLGTVNHGAVGFLVKAGGYIKLSAKVLIDIFLAYSTCSMEPDAFKFNVGGFQGGLGFGLIL
jgi:hypothetical protein